MKARPRRMGISTLVGLVVVVGVIVAAGLGVLAAMNGAAATSGSSSSASTGASSSAVSQTIAIPQGASSGLNFSPSTLTVSSGTTITFTDQDSGAPHNIYFTSVPSGASISSGPSPTLKQGDTYQVTLTTPGTYTFECQFHAQWMQGTITVTG